MQPECVRPNSGVLGALLGRCSRLGRAGVGRPCCAPHSCPGPLWVPKAAGWAAGSGLSQGRLQVWIPGGLEGPEATGGWGGGEGLRTAGLLEAGVLAPTFKCCPLCGGAHGATYSGVSPLPCPGTACRAQATPVWPGTPMPRLEGPAAPSVHPGLSAPPVAMRMGRLP